MEIYTVGEILYYIKTQLEIDDRTSDCWLQGEVSNCKRYASGHYYFDLKDESGQLRCVMFRQSAMRQSYLPQDGSSFIMHGFFDLYEGKLQFRVNEVLPGGLGRFHLEFEALKQKLDAEGLFAAERKRPLPPLPRRIGVVTSPNAAAFQDILKVLSRRYPLAEVVLSPTLVQGSEAPPQIAAAIKLINMLEGVDVIIVARGGGSIEDLWAFNDEQVARAIFASRYPVVTGVGHETDTTIVDFVADVRAPTPSAAAEIVTPNIADFQAALLEAVERLHDTVHVALDDKRMELNDVTRRLHLASPAVKVPAQKQQVMALRERGALHLNHALRLHKAELGALASRLKVLNPQQIMERGYALVTRAADGTIVTSAQDVRPGEALEIRLKDGTFEARVD